MISATEHFWQDCGATVTEALLPIRKLVDAAVSGSPYLTRLILRHCEFVIHLINADPNVVLANLNIEVLTFEHSNSRDQIASGLRIAKQKAALLIGLADLGQVWSVMEVTNALTIFADTCLNTSINFLLRENENKQKLSARD